VLQLFKGQSGIKQCPYEHVPADAGKAIEISCLHFVNNPTFQLIWLLNMSSDDIMEFLQIFNSTPSLCQQGGLSLIDHQGIISPLPRDLRSGVACDPAMPIFSRPYLFSE